ncbi:MAG: PglZ domain-containing protein, partial [bacterium]|nr:PglZ domain-containing protein [bacterium]
LALCEAVDDHQRRLPGRARSLDDLIDYYVSGLREVDRLHREFEGAVNDCMDAHDMMSDLIEKARGRYRAIASAAHDRFISHVERSGWPPPGRLANSDLFDDLIAPKLRESGRKVAFFLVDALRYELGVALEKQLAEDDRVEIQPAFAPLPSVTAVGMASLLPGASAALSLTRRGPDMVPALGDFRLTGVKQRM